MSRIAGDSLETKIAVNDLLAYIDEWNLESQVRRHTAQSTHSRKIKLGRFLWFIEYKKFDSIGPSELMQSSTSCALPARAHCLSLAHVA
jgi:hypothetical protein